MADLNLRWRLDFGSENEDIESDWIGEMNMKVTLKWEPILKEYDCVREKYVPSKLDRENIFLTVRIKGLPEEKAYAFLDSLEKKINEQLAETYGESYFNRCTSYEECESEALYDLIGWNRAFGEVREQKREIIKTIRDIANNLKKQFDR